MDSPARPGLAKARPERIFLRRAVALVRSIPGPIRDLVLAADIRSEGQVRQEAAGSVYYGSTTLLFANGPQLEPEITGDPHVRLHLLRVARREAEHRAGAPLGSVSAEISFRTTAAGLLASVDLVAPVEPALALATDRQSG